MNGLNLTHTIFEKLKLGKNSSAVATEKAR